MVRNDVIINWEVSPRIITVLAPSVNISMQDLYDTLRLLEADPANIDDDFIISGSGKETLGGGIYVGLTVTLNNAQLAFQSRSGPIFVQCSVSGGNLVAVDINRNNINPIYPTDYTQIMLTSSSSATLQEINLNQYSSLVAAAVLDASICTHQISGTIGKTISDATKETVKKIIPFLFTK